MVKERTCITIDGELLIKAKNNKINISAVTEAALLRELDFFEKNAYTKALEKQLTLFKEFTKVNNLQQSWEEWKFESIK